MNISEQPLDPNFLRKHPRSYTEEPMSKEIELFCSLCNRTTKHADFSFPPEIPDRWKCFECGEYRPSAYDSDKLGGRNQMREKIAELIRELEKERKRSARWKACAKEKDKRVDEYEDFIFSPKKRKQDDRQTD